MKKIVILILISLLFLSLLLALLPKPQITSYVKIGNTKFYVDVAKTDDQKEKGLDIYEKLPQKKGMLFLFKNEDYYPFWMKGMKFSIDIIYIRDNKIVDIFYELPFPKTVKESPIIVKPSEKANYVLEINAGLSRKYNFKKGDTVYIHL